VELTTHCSNDDSKGLTGLSRRCIHFSAYITGETLQLDLDWLRSRGLKYCSEDIGINVLTGYCSALRSIDNVMTYDGAEAPAH